MSAAPGETASHISLATRPGMKDRTITLMGLTKTFSMGGWRIGFVYAPENIISGMTKIQQHLMTCAGSFTQTGAIKALEDEASSRSQRTFGRIGKSAAAMWSRRSTRSPTSAVVIRKEDFSHGSISKTPESIQPVMAEKLLQDHHVAWYPEWPSAVKEKAI